MKSSKLLRFNLIAVISILTSVFIPLVTMADTISLIGSDAAGSTSFNTGLHWSNGVAPVPTNDYNTAGFLLRTPGNGTTNFTFGGHSLTLGAQNVTFTPGANFNGSMLEKFSTGAGTVRFLIINNFTNSNQALMRSGGTAGALIHIQGNVYVIAGTNSAINADQCIWVIDSPLVGADNVILTNFANNANDHIAYTATNSGFTGSLYLTAGNNTSSWSLEMDNVNSPPANPSTFNPGQITFLNLGQLRDVIGCSFTNSNGGFTLAANAIINTSVTTLIGEPITDLTNGVSSHSLLTSSGSGTLVLSNANNNYTGGTTISGGILQLGTANSVPIGLLTDNATFDLNTFNDAIDGLTGTGTIESSAGGTPTLVIGAAGGTATFSGSIQGAVNVIKTSVGSETFSAGYGYTGTTTVAGGTLSLVTSATLPSPAGDMIVSNGASLVVNAANGTALPVNNLVMATNSTLNLSADTNAIGLNASAGLTFQDNATNNIIYGTVTANPTAVPITTAGGISAPGTNITLNISALGLQTGTFSLIKYSGTALSSIANFTLVLPPGVFGSLVNNTGNDSIDVTITQVPTQLAWNGVAGDNWDLTTANWSNLVAGGISVFHQFDSVVLDDTLTNTSPEPTNINVALTVFPTPFVMNSTLPYSLSGPGGIAGTTSLVESNTGSWTILTSNSYTGGTFVYGGTLVINSDNALGANAGPVTLSGGNLQYLGSSTNSRSFSLAAPAFISIPANNTVQLGGTISGAGGLQKEDNGTLILSGKTTLPSGSAGNLFAKFGVVDIPTGGLVTNGFFDDIGQDTNDNATLNITGGSLTTLSDFNAGDLGASVGTVNISSGTLTVNALFVGSANLAGSTASGTINQTGGTVTQVNTAVGECVIGGRITGASGIGVYNMSGGTFTPNGNVRLGGGGTGTLNQTGGTINAILGVNIARLAGSIGTNNLNGGLLATFNMASSTGTNAVFNFNGGTLQAQFSPANPWFSGNIQANVLAGGAIIDSSSNNAVVTTPLLAGSPNGGLTKLGSGTLTLSGTNTFTGPITNNAGMLVLNGAGTYLGAVQINAGTVQITTASQFQAATTINTNASLSVIQNGSATANLGNLTFNGVLGSPGASLSIALTSGNHANVPFINAGTLTLNGTNSINLAGAANVGTIALLKYAGAIAGSGSITNINLPQGVVGSISNDVTDSILFAVITSTGPGIVWTGTNSTAGLTNLWDINSTTNWLLSSTPTRYQQVVIPGDFVTFNDSGSGTVTLNTNVGPGSLTISNNAKTYTFSGKGAIGGVTGLLKLGTGNSIMNLTNNSYTGNTTISNGTLQLGGSSSISPNANVVVGTSGTLELNGVPAPVFGDLTGSGIVDNASGNPVILTLGSSTGGTWNGTIQDHGGQTIALIKRGTGTWVIGGTNNLNNGASFSVWNQLNAGTTIITNGGLINIPVLELYVADGGGTVSSLQIAGGALSLSNALTIGTNGGVGTVVLNSGTISHQGGVNNAFNYANNIVVGGLNSSTGTLIVNGGQVLNSQALTIAQGAGSTGNFFLNGGLVQATAVQTGNAANATNFFNGGTLQATETNIDFIQVPSLVMSNGLVLDDGGFPVSIASQSLQSGDTFNGGLLKKGAGTLYLDLGNTYTGTTLVTNGTLAGVGSIQGPLVVAPNGNIGAGDAAGIGTFTANNTVTLQGTATFRIDVTGGSSQNDQIIGVPTANYGGTLVVSNITTDATLLTNGQTFQLFTATTGSGNFAHIVGSAGAGLSYVFYPATGVLGVTNAVVKSVPHITHIGVSGTTLNISGTNGTASSPYVLLGSTNVALPLASWTPLLTNTFGSDGSFNLSTNIVIPGVTNQFYILSQ